MAGKSGRYGKRPNMPPETPEQMAQAVIDACADCDVCRYLMEHTPSLMFPELYQLHDRAVAEQRPATSQELRHLLDLCNFCGLCPCPNIRSDLMKAKHAYVSRDGLKPTIRLLEDIARVAGICGAFPRLTNLLFQTPGVDKVLKSLTGIHTERKLPVFPSEIFPQWLQKRRTRPDSVTNGRKVAYFAGCTGQYLFPAVPKAVIEIFEHNGIEVHFPKQRCCGMPSLLEGDAVLALEFARFNLEHLAQAVDDGFDIVCSCPTCGFMLKSILGDGACHSVPYHQALGRGGFSNAGHGTALRSVQRQWSFRSNPVFEKLFQDEGYFASLDAVKRVKVAGRTYDLGEYLWMLHRNGALNTQFGPLEAHVVYYPPCHLREQKIGRPYWELLQLVPGTSLERIDGPFYCCGIAGIMGFKQDFHATSITMGKSLMERVMVLNPERLVTDCLSCRIQFNQLIPHQVLHPVEVLREAYDRFRV